MHVCAWDCKWKQGSRDCCLIAGGGVAGTWYFETLGPLLPRVGLPCAVSHAYGTSANVSE